MPHSTLQRSSLSNNQAHEHPQGVSGTSVSWADAKMLTIMCASAGRKVMFRQPCLTKRLSNARDSCFLKDKKVKEEFMINHWLDSSSVFYIQKYESM